MTTTRKKILLIGTGPTSSLISYNLAKIKNLNDFVDIHIWEKAKGIMGRFSSSRSPTNPNCFVDLGAQYLSQTIGNQLSKKYFCNLNENNLLRPLETEGISGFRQDPSKLHFSCVNGTGSIVKHFFEKASIKRCDIQFNQKITRIIPTEGFQVEVETKDKKRETFDFISTISPPQLLQLENFSELVTDLKIRENLESVKYSSRFAVGLYFDKFPLKVGSNHSLNFVDNDDVIRYWSLENLKRTGNYSKEPASIVIHTTINFGEKNISESLDNPVMTAELVKKASQFIPETATLYENDENAVKCHKWKYSQVMKPYSKQPGYVQINGNVLFAGDGFSNSGFEGCIESAEKTVSVIKAALKLA